MISVTAQFKWTTAIIVSVRTRL